MYVMLSWILGYDFKLERGDNIVQRMVVWYKDLSRLVTDFRQSPFWTISERVIRARTGAWGLGIVLACIVLAVGAPILAPFDPVEMHDGDEFQPPTTAYVFGTDQYGRDLASRIIFGARISLGVGVVSVILAALIGVTTGLIAGYSGGWQAGVLMRIWDMVLAFPPILIGIALATLLGSSMLGVTLTVAISSMPTFARLSQAKIMVEKGKEYVMASRACGASDLRIIFKTILPNCIPTILAQVTVAMASAVLLEAALSFLGLGSQPPAPSWGLMLSRSRPYLRKAPWWALFPGVAVSTMILGLNLLSDAVQDALDPTHVTKVH